MSNSNETIETWNKVAELYQEKFMYMTIYNESYDFLCQQLDPCAKVLELGCGPGMITKYLLSKKPQLQILGTDLAPNMIDLAKKNIPNAVFQVMDCRDIANLDRKFNAIVAGFCIPYLTPSEVKLFIKDCTELLESNGLFYVSFVPGDESQSHWQVGSSGDRVYFNYHSLENLTKVFLDHGLAIKKEFTVEYRNNNGDIEEHLIVITS